MTPGAFDDARGDVEVEATKPRVLHAVAVLQSKICTPVGMTMAVTADRGPCDNADCDEPNLAADVAVELLSL